MERELRYPGLILQIAVVLRSIGIGIYLFCFSGIEQLAV